MGSEEFANESCPGKDGKVCIHGLLRTCVIEDGFYVDKWCGPCPVCKTRMPDVSDAAREATS